MEIFRNLKSDEIECKISQISDTWISLLLYKTARTDMQLLDESVSPYNWKCEYKEIKNNMYCGLSIYDEKKSEWVTKWDCGVESEFGDKEKGEASDAFKRAGFKWGIGIELYTSPKIFITMKDKDGNINYEIKENNGKKQCKTTFSVEAIEITNKAITGLAIKNNKGKRVFVWKKG